MGYNPPLIYSMSAAVHAGIDRQCLNNADAPASEWSASSNMHSTAYTETLPTQRKQQLVLAAGKYTVSSSAVPFRDS